MWLEMPSQVVYQTNADYTATEEALTNNTLVVLAPTKKGLLWFRFVDSRTVFQLSPMGKLQVKWGDLNEKRTLYKLVKNLLVANQQEELVIKPLKQQLWIEYPVPDSFKVYWCDQASEFALKKPSETKQQEKPSQFIIELNDVGTALEQLRHEFRFLREPTFNEVAIKASCLDTRTMRIGLRLSRWEDQSQEEAKRAAEEALNLAAWLSYKEKSQGNAKLIALSRRAINSASLSAIKRAQVMLKNCPNLIPKVNSNLLTWPEETKVKWVEVFGDEPPVPQSWN